MAIGVFEPVHVPAAALEGSGRAPGRALESFPVSLPHLPTSRFTFLRVAFVVRARCQQQRSAVQSDFHGLSPEASRQGQVANVT
jgi:hypothetical protein